LGQEEETSPEVTEGSRVRVTSPVLDKRLEGTVAALDHTQLVVKGTDEGSWSVTIPREQITQLEVYKGSKGHAGLGALIGGGVFAVGGAILGAALDDWEFGGPQDDSNVDGAVGGALAFGLAGAGLGALVGLAVRSADWQEVELPQVEPMVTVRPRQNHPAAVTVGLRLRI
jgi:hypothetical protein